MTYIVDKKQVWIKDAITIISLLPRRHNDIVTKLLWRHYPTSLWRRHMVAMETSNNVAKTTSLQRLIKRRHNETLQLCLFCNVIWRFHCIFVAASERRWIATSQRRCKVVLSNGKQIQITKLYYYQYKFIYSEKNLFQNYFTSNRVFSVNKPV